MEEEMTDTTIADVRARLRRQAASAQHERRICFVIGGLLLAIGLVAL
jgi:hypothetical protein